MALSFAKALLGRVPPWLRRTVGKPLVLGLGALLDTIASNAGDAIRLRLPTGTVDPVALALTGAERRILRGPLEDDATYAGRLLTWWDDHRERGGPYALARQVWGYWRTSINPPFDIIYRSGRRFHVDAAGTITRDDIAWTYPPPGWAQYWIVFYLTGLSTTFVDALGDVVVTETGATLIFDTLTGGSVTAEEQDEFASVPREWSPAHVEQVNVLLVYGAGWFFDEPGVAFNDGHVWGGDGTVAFTITDF